MYFRKMKLRTSLLAVASAPYQLITHLRNFFFNKGILKQTESSISVISVGNLKMGGTGKTPHVAYLLDLLTPKNTSVISRGYKRATKGLIEGSKTDSATTLGDEPLELLLRQPDSSFKMIVDSNRRNALNYLKLNHPTTDIAILDDGYQHRYVNRDANILLSEFNNPFFHDKIFPAGSLRERKQEAKRADIIIFTKCPSSITPAEIETYKLKTSKYSSAKIFFTETQNHGVLNKENKLEDLNKHKKYLLVTGIANPNPIYEFLASEKIHFAAKNYKDHHQFSKKDINDILKKMENCDALLTTEKDWMRLKETNLPQLISKEIFRLSIGIQFVGSEQSSIFSTYLNQLLSKK